MTGAAQDQVAISKGLAGPWGPANDQAAWSKMLDSVANRSALFCFDV